MSLKDLDYLSPKISLFYYGRRRHSANFGGILTIIMLVLCILYITYLFLEVYLHSSSTIQYYRHFFRDQYIYLFNNTKGIFHYFQIYNPKNNSYVSSFNPKYIRMFMSKIQEQYKSEPELLNETEHWVYDNCRDGIDNKFMSKELFKNSSFQNGLCLRYYYNSENKNYYPIEDNENFQYPNLTSSVLNGVYSIGTIIEKCYNNSVLTKIFGPCGSEEEIDDYFDNNYDINFNILTNEVSPSNYDNHIYGFIYGISNPLKKKKVIENNIMISPLKIDINGGIFFPKRKLNQTYTFYENYVIDEEKKKDSPIIFIYNFCLTQTGYVFKSTYITLYDSFPKIGGIIQLIYYIFFCINFILNRFTIINDAKKLFFTLHNDEAVNGGVQIKTFSDIVQNLRKVHNYYTFNTMKNNNSYINKSNINNNYYIKNNFNFNKNDSFFQKNFENDNSKSLSIFPFLFDKNLDLYNSSHILNSKDKKILKENSDIVIQKRHLKAIKNKIIKEEINNIDKSFESKIEKKDKEDQDNNNESNNNIFFNIKKTELIEIEKSKPKNKEKTLYKSMSQNNIDNDIVYFKLLLEKYFDYKKKTFIYEKMNVEQIDKFFNFGKYFAYLFCYKKPRNYYLTLLTFRKKLLSEEHFFRTHNYLYLFEKCFDFQESQKIDIIELYKNL